MTENNYVLKFTPKASEDLKEIYDYISEKLFAEKAAERLFKKIESNVLNLKKSPYSCNAVFDEHLKIKGYCKLIIDNYIVFYLVDDLEKQVIAMRVLYGAQNYNGLI